MKSRSLASLLLLGAVGLMVLSGCGGGGSFGSSSGGDGGSFVSAVEAACTNANTQIAALGTPQKDEVTHYMLKTEAVIEKLQAEVEAAGGSSSAAQAYNAGLKQAVLTLTKMSNAARNENYDAVRELSAGLVKIHLGELAEAAELKACAEVPVSS